jgi:hypothetical protein
MSKKNLFGGFFSGSKKKLVAEPDVPPPPPAAPAPAPAATASAPPKSKIMARPRLRTAPPGQEEPPSQPAPPMSSLPSSATSAADLPPAQRSQSPAGLTFPAPSFVPRGINNSSSRESASAKPPPVGSAGHGTRAAEAAPLASALSNIQGLDSLRPKSIATASKDDESPGIASAPSLQLQPKPSTNGQMTGRSRSADASNTFKSSMMQQMVSTSSPKALPPSTVSDIANYTPPAASPKDIEAAKMQAMEIVIRDDISEVSSLSAGSADFKPKNMADKKVSSMAGNVDIRSAGEDNDNNRDIPPATITRSGSDLSGLKKLKRSSAGENKASPTQVAAAAPSPPSPPPAETAQSPLASTKLGVVLPKLSTTPPRQRAAPEKGKEAPAGPPPGPPPGESKTTPRLVRGAPPSANDRSSSFLANMNKLIADTKEEEVAKNEGGDISDGKAKAKAKAESSTPPRAIAIASSSGDTSPLKSAARERGPAAGGGGGGFLAALAAQAASQPVPTPAPIPVPVPAPVPVPVPVASSETVAKAVPVPAAETSSAEHAPETRGAPWLPAGGAAEASNGPTRVSNAVSSPTRAIDNAAEEEINRQASHARHPSLNTAVDTLCVSFDFSQDDQDEEEEEEEEDASNERLDKRLEGGANGGDVTGDQLSNSPRESREPRQSQRQGQGQGQGSRDSGDESLDDVWPWLKDAITSRGGAGDALGEGGGRDGGREGGGEGGGGEEHAGPRQSPSPHLPPSPLPGARSPSRGSRTELTLSSQCSRHQSPSALSAAVSASSSKSPRGNAICSLNGGNNLTILTLGSSRDGLSAPSEHGEHSDGGKASPHSAGGARQGQGPSDQPGDQEEFDEDEEDAGEEDQEREEEEEEEEQEEEGEEEGEEEQEQEQEGEEAPRLTPRPAAAVSGEAAVAASAPAPAAVPQGGAESESDGVCAVPAAITMAVAAKGSSRSSSPIIVPTREKSVHEISQAMNRTNDIFAHLLSMIDDPSPNAARPRVGAAAPSPGSPGGAGGGGEEEGEGRDEFPPHTPARAAADDTPIFSEVKSSYNRAMKPSPSEVDGAYHRAMGRMSGPAAEHARMMQSINSLSAGLSENKPSRDVNELLAPNWNLQLHLRHTLGPEELPNATSLEESTGARIADTARSFVSAADGRSRERWSDAKVTDDIVGADKALITGIAVPPPIEECLGEDYCRPFSSALAVRLGDDDIDRLIFSTSHDPVDANATAFLQERFMKESGESQLKEGVDAVRKALNSSLDLLDAALPDIPSMSNHGALVNRINNTSYSSNRGDSGGEGEDDVAEELRRSYDEGYPVLDTSMHADDLSLGGYTPHRHGTCPGVYSNSEAEYAIQNFDPSDASNVDALSDIIAKAVMACAQSISIAADDEYYYEADADYASVKERELRFDGHEFKFNNLVQFTVSEAETAMDKSKALFEMCDSDMDRLFDLGRSVAEEGTGDAYLNSLLKTSHRISRHGHSPERGRHSTTSTSASATKASPSSRYNAMPQAARDIDAEIDLSPFAGTSVRGVKTSVQHGKYVFDNTSVPLQQRPSHSSNSSSSSGQHQEHQQQSQSHTARARSPSPGGSLAGSRGGGSHRHTHHSTHHSTHRGGHHSGEKDDLFDDLSQYSINTTRSRRSMKSTTYNNNPNWLDNDNDRKWCKPVEYNRAGSPGRMQPSHPSMGEELQTPIRHSRSRSPSPSYMSPYYYAGHVLSNSSHHK